MARCWDDDGEFLLIEASERLPRWIQPSNSRNRVFVHRGEVKVLCHHRENRESVCEKKDDGGVCGVGGDDDDDDDDGNDVVGVRREELVLAQALSTFTRSRGEEDAASIDLESEETSKRVDSLIEERLVGFPERATEMQQHTCVCQLPRRAALVLERHPRAIAQAVHSFFYRGPQDMKALRSLNKGGRKRAFCIEESKLQQLLVVRVKMNRSHYAQLMQQQFAAPRYVYPQLPEKSSPKFLSAELGMKVTSGLEMFHSRMERDFTVRGKERKGGTRAAEVQLPEEWESFQERLKSLGYFKAEVEGSEHYKELLEEAKASFSSKWKGYLHECSPEDLLAWKEIKKQLSACCSTEDEEEEEEAARGKKKIDCPADLLSEIQGDDDSWLYDGEKVLEEKMKAREEDNRMLKELVNSFVNHESSFEGAEFPNHQAYETNEETGDSDSMTFDPNKFFQVISEAVGGFEKEQEALFSSDSDDEDEATGEGASAEEVELEAVQNLLKSVKLQDGLPGPASNLMGVLEEM